LKDQGKLGAWSGKSPTQTAAPSGATPVGGSFSSFPETLVRLFIHPGGNCIDFDLIFPQLSDPPDVSNRPTENLGGLDFESVTLMRLRQAEREKQEREIREQEENE
jgi:DnaJ homolog subfamily C member 17